MIPAQGQFFLDQFGGEFKMKTFVNNNTDNRFIFESGDVRILVEEGRKSIKLELGGNDPLVSSGKVESEQKEISFCRPSSNVGEINRAKRDALKEHLGGSDDLYEAWVSEFGEESITEDRR